MTLDHLIEKLGGVAVLAERLGVSKTAVYQWRAGVTSPSAKHLIALHRISSGRLDLESFDA